MEAYNGRRSLQIKFLGGTALGVATSTFPLEEAPGKTLQFTGHIKSENITSFSGWAGLWIRVDGEDAISMTLS